VSTHLHLCVWLCLCVCAYVHVMIFCVSACLSACESACVCVCVCVCGCEYVFVGVRVYIYEHSHIHISIHVCSCMCVCVCLRVFVYIFTYVCMCVRVRVLVRVCVGVDACGSPMHLLHKYHNTYTLVLWSAGASQDSLGPMAIHVCAVLDSVLDSAGVCMGVQALCALVDVHATNCREQRLAQFQTERRITATMQTACGLLRLMM